MRMLEADSSAASSPDKPGVSVVTNVGHRPTFGDTGGLIAEAHVIDFEGDLYGKKIELSFEHRLRAEQKFADVDALRRQIARDVDEARRWLARA